MKNIEIKTYHVIGTYFGFASLGMAFGSWAMLVPFAKDRLHVNHSQLGFMLLAIALGAVVSMFFTGILSARFGCRPIITVSAAAMTAMLPVLASAESIHIMIAAMFILGSGMGMLDVALNIQGALSESGTNKHLMSGFHSMYSFGVFFGIIFMTIFFNMGLKPLQASIVTAMILLVIILLLIKTTLTAGGDTPKKLFTKPSRILFVLGIVCFIAYVSEGVILDWSALFMIESRNVLPENAGYAFSLFYLTMGIFRLAGDRIAQRLSEKSIMTLSSVSAVAGILIMLFIPAKSMAFVGFAVAGGGLANIVPVTVSAAGKYRGNMPVNIAVSSVATVGYFGTLLGPVVMGIVSKAIGISAAFAGVAAIILIIAVLSRGLK
ncbi:MAG: MFS transporter [Mucispirillum sp.]|nr:MFS transporter [Mucispirillum sp.]